MAVILFILFAVTVLCLFLGLRFLKKYNAIKSTENYESEAKKKAAELSYKDPVISCDYCGNAIDTAIYKKCPVCGGEYSLDREWIERHKIDMNEFDRAADEHSKRQIQKYDKAAHSLLTLFKIFLIIGCSIFLLFAGLFIAFIISENIVTYQESEVVNVEKNDNYKHEAYGIKENAKFFEYEGVSAEVTGVYRDEAKNIFKIEITLKNNSVYDKANIRYDIVGVNGLMDGSIRMNRYDHVREIYIEPGKEIKVYEQIKDLDFEGISSLFFTDITLYDKSDFLKYDTDYHRVDTTCTVGKITDEFFAGMEKVFENDRMDIYVLKRENNDSAVYFVNKSDEDFTVKADSARVNNTTVSGARYEELVPAGVTMMDVYMGATSDEIYRNMGPNDSFYVNYVVSCQAEGSLGFFTDYLKIR